jgi:mutual gliding-motility protein MglA
VEERGGTGKEGQEAVRCQLRVKASPTALATGTGCAISTGQANSEAFVPFINFPAREINCKLVYYGPGLGGKTANLQWIYEHTGTGQKGKMVSLATETDRTLFFDFLPLDLGTVRGFRTRFHLYTVPGQVFYEASRRLILKGADGVVFVADSQEERLDANLETLDNLREHLKDHNLDFTTIPYVLQLNKRDLPNILSVEALKKELSVKGEPALEAVAVTGQGVFDTLKEVAKLVLAELKKNS